MPSSVIDSHDYIPEDRLLSVCFTSGKRYAYFDVPAEEVRRFRAAMSKGAYFNTHIRGRYRCSEIEPAE